MKRSISTSNSQYSALTSTCSGTRKARCVSNFIKPHVERNLFQVRDSTASAENVAVEEDILEVDPPSTKNIIQIENMAYLVGTSVDLSNDIGTVDLVLALPGGTDAESVEFALSADGTDAVISFSWPQCMYVIEELYEAEIRKNFRVDSTIQTLRNELKDRRAKVSEAPRTKITIALPIPVQTDYDTWVKTGIRGRDGALVVKAKFKAYQKAYSVVEETRKVKFPKLDDTKTTTSATNS